MKSSPGPLRARPQAKYELAKLAEDDPVKNPLRRISAASARCFDLLEARKRRLEAEKLRAEATSERQRMARFGQAVRRAQSKAGLCRALPGCRAGMGWAMRQPVTARPMRSRALPWSWKMMQRTSRRQ